MTATEEEKLWNAGLAIAGRLEQAGHRAFLVGGCVRDRKLGRDLHDIDIATSALPEQVTELFARVIPTGLKHGTVTVLEEGLSFEVTTFRQEKEYSDSRRPDRVEFVADIREDLARRDFTINAMAIGIDGRLVDPYGGEGDLRNRLVRAVGQAKTRFGEDALRMLRAIRFAAELGFELEGDTLVGLRATRERLAKVSMERVGAELDKMIAGRCPERALRLLGESGLLRHTMEPIADALPDAAASEAGRFGGLAKIETPEARWAALLIAAGADRETGLRLARALRFSARRAEAIAAVIGVQRIMVDEAETLPSFRDRWVEAVVVHGDEAALRWLAIARAMPELADWSSEESREFTALAEAALAAMPALTVRDLTVRGDEAARAVGRKAGPWVAVALGSLLRQTARGELPNEKTALIRALLEQQAIDGREER